MADTEQAHDANAPGGKKPISAARLAANIANSKLSTGPRSARGKAVSSMNNYRNGLRTKRLILPWESQ